MIETLESRQLLSALPVTHDPVDTTPRTVRIVTLEEFLGMESWNDDEIVVEWYSDPSESDEDDDWYGDDWGDSDDDWAYEPEEEDMSGEDDVCDGEPLDDEDFELVEEWDVLDEPIVIVASDEGGAVTSFSDETSIASDLLGTMEDGVLG